MAISENSKGRLDCVQGDLTTLRVDAIVNAANSTLLGGGGVDGAIHRAAGPELRNYCARLGGCPTGEARLTPGFRLRARYVIHTVGPIWSGGGRGEAALLAACYRNVFRLAREHDVARIPFPAISCGAYRYPKDQAVRVAVRECMRALEEDSRLSEVLLVAFDDEMRALYQREISAHD